MQRLNHTYFIVLGALILIYLIGRKDGCVRTLEYKDYRLFFTYADYYFDERLNFWGYKRLADEVTYDYHIRTFLIFGRKLYVDRVIEIGERNRGV